MSKVISVHEYVLKPLPDKPEFERAIRDSQGKGLVRLPGLESHYFVKGIRGSRRGYYAAIWVYESREVWEELWGPPDRPKSENEYPENWRIWENEVLAPFLEPEPDKISFTAYQEF